MIDLIVRDLARLERDEQAAGAEFQAVQARLNEIAARLAGIAHTKEHLTALKAEMEREASHVHDAAKGAESILPFRRPDAPAGINPAAIAPAPQPEKQP